MIKTIPIKQSDAIFGNIYYLQSFQLLKWNESSETNA